VGPAESEKCCRKKIVEKIKTQVLLSMTFFFENPTFYETMSKNMVQPERQQMTIKNCAERMFCIPDNWLKNTDTLSLYLNKGRPT